MSVLSSPHYVGSLSDPPGTRRAGRRPLRAAGAASCKACADRRRIPRAPLGRSVLFLLWQTVSSGFVPALQLSSRFRQVPGASFHKVCCLRRPLERAAAAQHLIFWAPGSCFASAGHQVIPYRQCLSDLCGYRVLQVIEVFPVVRVFPVAASQDV